MAQADYSIANQGFPATRADINSHLEAIATNNSGTSAPSTQYAGQFWIDTTSSTWTLYIHDGADDIQFATIDTSANTVNFTDSALDVVTDTTPQLGGDLDLNSNDITGTGDINITGDITASGNLLVDTIEPQSGTTLTLGASGDTINLASGATAGFGKVAQVVMGTTTTSALNTLSTYADTNLTADITPSSTSSKILVLVSQAVYIEGTGSSAGSVRVNRNGTIIAGGDQRFERYIGIGGATSTQIYTRINITYLDTPSSTSTLTYKTQSARYLAGDEIETQKSGIESTIVLMEILG
jgi:hypothetical protein